MVAQPQERSGEPEEWMPALPDSDAFRLAPDESFCTKGKWLLDVTGASLLLVLLLPVILLAAVAIKCDTRGPVLFCQKRLGKGGKPFVIFKFRTMRGRGHPYGGEQAGKNDPRVTWTGKWLRRSSIDELPQLLNVLRGEMSLVGPRPHAVAHDMYFSQHVTGYWKRYAIKPGLTGFAQVKGWRGRTFTIDDMQQRIDHDLVYIRRRTLIMDIWILMRTIGAVLRPPRNLY